jgi:hypothetical protein
MGILTAYFGPETFDVLDDVVAAGVAAVEVVLAANAASRASWEAARDYSNAAVQVHVARSSPGGILHPKLVVAESPAERMAIVGSSNFTSGGLWGNVELNIALIESAPLLATSPVSVLHQVFADAFAIATRPSSSLWADLINSSPARVATRGAGSSRRLQAALSQLPPIGTPILVVGRSAPAPPQPGQRQRMPRTQPAASPAGTYNTLLFQLSNADVDRPGWSPTGVGTSQSNLPRTSLGPLGLTAAYTGDILVEAVGVGTYAGASEVHEAGLWQRDPRGPGRIPEAARFTFKAGLKEFVKADTGSPSSGDVCVIEVPAGGISTANPLRVAVIPAATATALGVMPSGNRRGTKELLFWDVRPGTVL